MFFKGALLNDPHGLLKKPGESTQAARQIRFTNVREIVEMEPILKAYIFLHPNNPRLGSQGLKNCMEQILNGKGLNDQ